MLQPQILPTSESPISRICSGQPLVVEDDPVEVYVDQKDGILIEDALALLLIARA